MAEASAQTTARLWDRPAVAWRLVVLVLAVYPQSAGSRVPDLSGPTEGTATIALHVREPGPVEAWIDYLSQSGLVLLVLAVAFLLPGTYGRRAVFGVTWGLGLLGALAASGAGSGEDAGLWVYGVCYLLGATVLAVAGVRAALATTDTPT